MAARFNDYGNWVLSIEAGYAWWSNSSARRPHQALPLSTDADRITLVEARPANRRTQAAGHDERLMLSIADSNRIEENSDGGMARLQVTDLAVNRIVAVKILHPHLIPQANGFAFSAEANYRSPSARHIINMHHFSPDVIALIFMDYVSGWALSDILPRRQVVGRTFLEDISQWQTRLLTRTQRSCSSRS